MFRSVIDAKKPIQNASVVAITHSPRIKDIILDLLSKREAKGMETYGVPFEDANDGRDWTIEVIEELLDALQYASKEILELREQLKTPFDS